MPKPVNAFVTSDGIIFGDRVEAENYEIRVVLTDQFAFTPENVDLVLQNRFRLEKLFSDVKKDHCNVLDWPTLPDQAESEVEAKAEDEPEA